MKDYRNSGKTIPDFTPRRLALAAAGIIGQQQQGMVLYSCEYKDDPNGKYEVLAALGCQHYFVVNAGSADSNTLNELQDFIHSGTGWLFCCIGYDLKNGIEKLASANPDRVDFPDLIFFRPEAVAGFRQGEYFCTGSEVLLSRLEDSLKNITGPTPNAPLEVCKTLTRDQYLNAVKKTKLYIQDGDIYEMNFCQEFFAKTDNHFSPEEFWAQLTNASPAPFSSFFRWNSYFLASASPERFLLKEGSRLISQPMKGTIRRGINQEEDQRLKEQLLASEKERAENVMITDLVRNDLSKVAEKGSVKVDELFGIYAFPQVHQMISTVSCNLKPGQEFRDLLQATFPMGSMTGAPKIRAMQIIEELEFSRRGLFSGSVGYISPDGDFDLNVIIRSVVGNTAKGILSFHTGGAITSDAIPEEEYTESLLKASAIIKILNNTSEII